MNVTVGTSIALAILAAFFFISALFACTVFAPLLGDDPNSPHNREIRERLLQTYRHEQEDWRSRRLHDVVLLLIQRGEVVEGVPLAAQIPGRDEVCCRRRIRQYRLEQIENELMDQVREEQERSVFPPEIYEATLRTLDELLAHGRPPEAEAGPDIMQLLLDGQEPHELSSNNGDSESENDENNSEYWVDETQQNTHVPSLATSPLESQPPNELSESPQHDHHDQHSLSANNNNIDSNNNQRVAGMNDDHNEQQLQEEQHHEDSNNENDTNNITTVMTEAEARHARWVEERQAAILRELHAEQARRNRRRRTSEEVYGVGVPYLSNPFNLKRELSSCSNVEELPQSPVMRFLSPMSPFRNRNRRRTLPSLDESGNYNVEVTPHWVGVVDNSRTHSHVSTATDFVFPTVQTHDQYDVISRERSHEPY